MHRRLQHPVQVLQLPLMLELLPTALLRLQQVPALPVVQEQWATHQRTHLLATLLIGAVVASQECLRMIKVLHLLSTNLLVASTGTYTIQIILCKTLRSTGNPTK